MNPQLSADLHAAGLITTSEALWVYGDGGRIATNVKALFDNRGLCFDLAHGAITNPIPWLSNLLDGTRSFLYSV